MAYSKRYDKQRQVWLVYRDRSQIGAESSAKAADDLIRYSRGNEPAAVKKAQRTGTKVNRSKPVVGRKVKRRFL